MNKTEYKQAKTVKEYTVNYNGYKLTIPVGSIVNNKTACGYDDNYRFLQNFNDLAEKATGFKNSILKHDLTYYGLNIPSKYCEKYK